MTFKGCEAAIQKVDDRVTVLVRTNIEPNQEKLEKAYANLAAWAIVNQQTLDTVTAQAKIIEGLKETAAAQAAGLQIAAQHLDVHDLSMQALRTDAVALNAKVDSEVADQKRRSDADKAELSNRMDAAVTALEQRRAADKDELSTKVSKLEGEVASLKNKADTETAGQSSTEVTALSSKIDEESAQRKAFEGRLKMLEQMADENKKLVARVSTLESKMEGLTTEKEAYRTRLLDVESYTKKLEAEFIQLSILQKKMCLNAFATDLNTKSILEGIGDIKQMLKPRHSDSSTTEAPASPRATLPVKQPHPEVFQEVREFKRISEAPAAAQRDGGAALLQLSSASVTPPSAASSTPSSEV